MFVFDLSLDTLFFTQTDKGYIYVIALLSVCYVLK